MPKTTQERWKTYRARNANRPTPHGTVNAYDNFSCRCEPCRAAKREKMNRYRKRLLTQALTKDRAPS